MNYLDSATSYGECEKYIGLWLKNNKVKRDDLLIGSKVSDQELNKEKVVSAIDASLKKVGLDYFDVYWAHKLPETNYESMLSGFHKAIEIGKIRSYGLCHVNAESLEKVFKICEERDFIKPQFIQNLFSLATQSKETKSAIEFCQKNSLIFTAASPLAGGILTGKYSFDKELPEDSRWGHWEKSRGLPKYWTKNMFDSIEVLQKEAIKKEVPLIALTLAWVKNYGGVHSVLLGPRTVKQLEPLKEALSLNLNKKEVQKLSDIFLVE